MIRFDERRLKKNDGDDFRDFVGEFLRASTGFGRPLPRDSGSVDGCIDLYCSQEGIVVECKFVGASVKNETDRVDQEWADVSQRLERNLLTEAGQAKPARSPYLPWADTERPIKRYIFVTSACLANEAKQRDLVSRIQSFFRDRMSTRSGYAHLRDVNVEVIDWTGIAAQVVDHPALVFKWLEQWPEGFAELDDRSPVGFRAFFHSDKLPYLARDSWQAPGGFGRPWTETSLIEELVRPETRDPIIVLIGQGGVGKTRLGLECGRRMRRLGWWTIRCNGLLAKTAGLRKILEQSSTSTRVLLFVDYLETWPTFEGFANDVLELNQSSGHQIRIIATCRTSYRERLATFMKVKVVGGQSRIEVAYSEAVTRHILNTVGGTDVETLAAKCRNNFALAAFLTFLSHERPGKFAVELSELRQESSFEAWIVRRLQNAGLREIDAAAAILAACDFTVTAFDSLAEAHGGSASDLRRILVADKWIERRETAESSEDSPVWAAFHDIFADVVLAHAIDVAPDRDDALDRILDVAVANGVFRQTFTALGRLKQIEALATVDWRVRLLELERRKPGALAEYARLLLANTLLTPEARLAMIISNAALEKAIASDPSCDLGLALTAAALSAAHDDDPTLSKFDRTIVPLLDIAMARPRQGNIILRLGFKTRPERYRAPVLSWIIAHPTSFQTHFLLKGWLDEAVAKLKADASGYSVHVEAVGTSVSAWLAAHEVSDNATFVLAAWLNAAAAVESDVAAAGMVARVADHMIKWLAYRDHAANNEAQFVYTSWFQAAATLPSGYAVDMVAKVAGHMTAWLDRDDLATIDEAQFVYTSWLSVAATIKGDGAAGMVASIKDHVTAWLAHGGHAVAYGATFIYKSYFGAVATIRDGHASDLVSGVRNHLEAWLAHGDNAIQDEAQFVYVSWLDAAGAVRGSMAWDMVNKIVDPVMSWLTHDDRSINGPVIFIYPCWLHAAAAVGGDRAAVMVGRIEAFVWAWLADADHAIQRDAQFVYAGWLEAALAIKGDRAGNMISKIKNHVAAWLGQDDYAVSERAMYIYKPWLESANQDQLRQFYSEMLTWISFNKDSSYCDYVLESWLDKGLEFDPVADACFRAVRRLRDSPDATFILKHVVRRHELPEDILIAALSWCERFFDHEDVLSRLGPLVTMDRAKIVGPNRLTAITAKVFNHLKLENVADDSSKRASLRATLGSLFSIGVAFPTAEKLARIYFARWLRDGRLFRPLDGASSGQSLPIFDQKIALVEALLTLVTYREFVPVTDQKDKAVLEQFCRWVGQWAPSNRKAIAELVEELSDRFGLPHLWQRMLAEGSN